MNNLTKREKQVYSLLTEGLSDKQISERLGITPKTAGLHVYRVLRKLGYTRRNQIMLATIAQLQQEIEAGLQKAASSLNKMAISLSELEQKMEAAE